MALMVVKVQLVPQALPVVKVPLVQMVVKVQLVPQALPVVKVPLVQMVQVNGSQGTTGTTGSTGSQGTAGTNGTQGTTGSTGSTGSQGTTGTQGIVGTTGSQGTTGTTGSTGSQGTTGAQGTSAATAITNNTDNYVVTATGNGTTPFNGEANLTFNGSTLALTGDLAVSSDAYVVETFLAGENVLPNSTFTLADGSTSAITPNSTFAQNSTVGEVIVGINAGPDITRGQLLWLRHSGDWHIADASSTSTSLKILGIALKSVTSGNPVDVLIDGVISMDSTYLTVSSIGESLYVDTTAGKITNTAPSGGGEVVRIVGHYIKAETGYSIITFKPDGTWIEL
jgi:hypothetical protein